MKLFDPKEVEKTYKKYAEKYPSALLASTALLLDLLKIQHDVHSDKEDILVTFKEAKHTSTWLSQVLEMLQRKHPQLRKELGNKTLRDFGNALDQGYRMYVWWLCFAPLDAERPDPTEPDPAEPDPADQTVR